MTPQQTDSPQEKPGKSGWRRLLLLGAGLLAVIVLARASGLGAHLGDVRDWIHGLGVWGAFVFIGIYALGTVVALPGSALTVAAGALFGSLWGFIIVNIAATIGASLAFLLSRYAARGAMEKWLSGKEQFRRLDALTAEHGDIIVAITRLVPLFPFNLLNYGFGLTRVSFGVYVFWTWLCIIPGDILYIVGTDAVVEGLRRGEVPWPLVGIVVVTGLILSFLVAAARRRLKQKGSGLET